MKPDKNNPAFFNAVSVDLMRRSDKNTIDNYISGRELMRRAAQGVLNSVNWDNKNIIIFSGSGNNGADGYALAGLLVQRGIFPVVVRTSDKLSDDGEYYYNNIKNLGVQILPFSDSIDIEKFDIIVDCILGTGFHGEPTGSASQAIKMINSSSAYVVSVDINSGMNGDTGEAVLAVHSNLTVSIGSFKKGLFLGRAPELIDDMVNVDIGIEILPE